MVIITGPGTTFIGIFSQVIRFSNVSFSKFSFVIHGGFYIDPSIFRICILRTCAEAQKDGSDDDWDGDHEGQRHQASSGGSIVDPVVGGSFWIC